MNMGSGMAMGMTGSGMTGMDINDVEYDAFLANDRTLADPEIVRVERGGRVRLRVINGASSSQFWIDLGDLTGYVVATDGHAVQPAFAPLGFDEKISVGVLASFAAREVIVSTLGMVTGAGEEAEVDKLTETLRQEKRPDGTPLFDTATCLSLLVFFVLAMQCLPTQAITRRESGSWRWAAFQLAYMTALAYTAAFVAYQGASLAGW